MATPAQAAAATVGAGSLAAAGSYGITQAVKGSSEEESTTEETRIEDLEVKEPDAKRLDSSNDPAYPEHTIAHKTENKPHLVNAKDKSNSDWWDWAFKNKFQVEIKKQPKPIHDLFNNVNKHFQEFTTGQETNITSLNFACHKAYSSMWFDIFPGNHLLENIRLFCTWKNNGSQVTEPAEHKPTTIVSLSENTSVTISESNKVGNNSTNKPLLVAHVGITDKSNRDWWYYVFKKHYLAWTEKDKIKDPFSKVVSPYSETEVSSAENDETSLNQACLEAYKKDVKTSETDLVNNIKKFCSKDNTGTNLQFTNGG